MRRAPVARVACALLAVAPLVSACHTTDPANTGQALYGDHNPLTLVASRHPHAGTVFAYAFPWLTNISDHPVRVTGFAIAHLPQNAELLRFAVLDSHETGGRALDLSLHGTYRPENLGHYPNHIHDPLVIPPHHTSTRYPMAVIKQTGPVHQLVTGCIVHYVTQHRHYTQTLFCGYQLWEPDGE
jgi:hypothetical protein